MTVYVLAACVLAPPFLWGIGVATGMARRPRHHAGYRRATWRTADAQRVRALRASERTGGPTW